MAKCVSYGWMHGLTPGMLNLRAVLTGARGHASHGVRGKMWWVRVPSATDLRNHLDIRLPAQHGGRGGARVELEARGRAPSSTDECRVDQFCGTVWPNALASENKLILMSL